jgi:hypothetical protein
MKKLFSLAVVFTALAGSTFGNITFLSSPNSIADTVNWSSIGGDGTLFANGQTATSGSTGTVTIGLGTQPALGGLTSVVCAAVPVSCSWPNQPSGFATDDTLIWLEGQDANQTVFGTGPLTLTWINSVFGLGAYLQATSSGAFSATLALYHGASLLATSATYNSDVAGDPLFLGAQDTSKEITKAVFTVTACGGFACDVNDFAVDTLDIFGSAAVPEPSTFALSGMLLAVGFAVRKHLARGNK